MPYNPDKHRRRSLRLPHYDYASPGAYFITICTYQRQCLFGEIRDGVMKLNKFGEVARDCWQAIPDHFAHVQLDAFVVMPNHIHGIIVITDNTRRGTAMPCPYPTPQKRQFGESIPGSLPTIIGAYKSAVTKRINAARKVRGISIWQRNYYEHIIRNDIALDRIRRYVQNNPASWQADQLHPDLPSQWCPPATQP
ncbi:MAG: transposase [Cyanobacteria bacterium P01_H01_bin.162]